MIFSTFCRLRLPHAITRDGKKPDQDMQKNQYDWLVIYPFRTSHARGCQRCSKESMKILPKILLLRHLQIPSFTREMADKSHDKNTSVAIMIHHTAWALRTFKPKRSCRLSYSLARRRVFTRLNHFIHISDILCTTYTFIYVWRDFSLFWIQPWIVFFVF
jgi:hypothetical protein